MFAIIASDADNLRRPNCGQQCRFGQRDCFDLPRAKALHVAIGFFGRRQQDANNGIAPGDWLNQSVMGLTIN